MENWSYFNLEELKPLASVKRFDDNKGNRFYYFVDGDEVIIASGVTSVLSLVSTERFAIDKWKEDNPDWQHILKVSSEYGTLLHEVFGDIMLGKGISINKLEAMQTLAYENGQGIDMPRKDVLAFIKFCEDTNLKPLIIEGVLAWKDPQGNYLAMTIDLLAEATVQIKTKEIVQDGFYVKGEKKGTPKMVEVTKTEDIKKVILIDFKSNFFEKDKKTFYESHVLQLLAAKLAVEQNFKIKVDEVYNWSPNNWRDEPTYTFKKHDIDNRTFEIFNAYWNLAKVKGFNRPIGKILITKDFKNSSDFKYVNYAEYARQYLLGEVQETDQTG